MSKKFFVLLLFCLVARAAIRRTRSEPCLLAAGTEWLLTSVAREEPVLRYRPTVSAALLRGEAYLPARRAVPVALQDRFSLLSLDAAVCTVLYLRFRLVRRAERIVVVIADVAAAVVVELAAARVLVR